MPRSYVDGQREARWDPHHATLPGHRGQTPHSGEVVRGNPTPPPEMRCTRCGGRVFRDGLDDTYSCLPCGKTWY